MTRYIFITGGVVSSLGKGLSTAVLGALLQARGYKVRLRKLDPYLNVDPGTMSPYQHGEVFVTDDGAETDLDLGHYERFTGCVATRQDNITAGRIYRDILAKERKGSFEGQTIQVIPHVTDHIKSFILEGNAGIDFVLCEIGGTAGDIEGLPFFEAIRQLGQELPAESVAYVHLTLVPYISTSGEIKTKPTQHSVKELRSIGIQPDILVCRCSQPIPEEDRRKISAFCNVKFAAVIQALDSEHIYAVPEYYHREGLDTQVLLALGIQDAPAPDLTVWTQIMRRMRQPDGEVTIAVVGKYMDMHDTYKSLYESLTHGGIAHNVRVHIARINAENITLANVTSHLKNVQGVLVPGGFGSRGTEGMIAAANYARTHRIPYFGICFGMQLAIVEAVRHIAKIKSASSTEFGPTDAPVVALLEEWEKDGVAQQRSLQDNLGGTMRVGAYETLLRSGSLVEKIYNCAKISERHRHRYEVNSGYKEAIEKTGLQLVGASKDGNLFEIVELPDHPWYVGVQFHPEFKSTPFMPHPLFASFIEACVIQSRLM